MGNSVFCFEASKFGELTCSFEGKYLHSKYNPVAEGEKFVQNVRADFSPFCVFIIEPALSYCATFLRKRFPVAKLCAIRFCDDFSETDRLWDFVFHLNSDLSEDLFNCLGEEKLISSLIFDWNATKLAFPEESVSAWKEIKKAVLKARDVIGTRAYFSKRWLKNSLIFATYIQNPVLAKKTNLPVIVAASGPSLKSSLPFLKKFRSSFFLIAVSSAFMPLLRNSIVPDFVMSSDGGYWAKKHLDFSKNACETIFALETESAVPKKILVSRKLLPLVYEDSLGKDFLDSLQIPYLVSKRNGTVAGTALEFALAFTNKNVYLCGQDLAPAPAFQHTQPNALETDSAKKDFRLCPTETRISASRFHSEKTLEIYRNWFASNSNFFAKRTFRLSDNFKYQYSLGKIKDINWGKFEKDAQTTLRQNAPTTPENAKKQALDENLGTQERNSEWGGLPKKRGEILISKLNELSTTPKFTKEVFPMDSILIKREQDEKKKTDLQAKLNEKIKTFLEECKRVIVC